MAEGEFQIQAQWVIDPGSIPVTVNQILLQSSVPTASTGRPDGVYVTFGHLNPPMIMDPTDPEQIAAASRGVYPVTSVARVYVSRERLVSFRDAIDSFLNTMPESTAE
jgi:hypothetical protein